MKLKAVRILLLFALLSVSYIQAVVVGPQQLHNNNKNGYRYNGPAHKYLPSEESPSHGSNLDSASDLGHGHRQQAFNGPYSSQYYQGQQQQGQEHQQHGQGQQQHGQGQQQHRPQQEEDDSWQSVFSQQQQQHQSLGNNQQHHQISGHQAYNEGAAYQQHQGLGNGPHRQQASNQQNQGHQLNQHSYEPSNSQQQQHHQGLGHQQHQQQRQESWNSIQGQQEAESWLSSQGHGFQQQQHQQLNQQQHQQQQQQHNRFGQQQLPLRGDLWQPIRELDLEKLPSAEAIANSHKTIAAPGRDVKLVPSYTLSSDFEHDRFIGLDAQDTRLLTQSLPDAYRKQLFSSPSGPSSLGQRQHEQQLNGSPAYGVSHGGSLGGSYGGSLGGSLGGSHGASLGGSSSDFLQMQSHSYQLPSTHSTHREWPQEKEQQQQQHGSQQLISGNRQYSASAYAVAPSDLHSSQPSQPSKNSLTHPSRDFQPPYY
ncbi:hybrid signal transduction histidine kinase L [Drosophila subpulchrella]|uniref:hybrid signal transduction histidine kinase L n=1 Tax=Drosophila subpulchrella TaxID=1486046 RepID=UPI0018A15905|nr:hybrid signal transduction histidine kinase L [Drosophila subpulchrella]